VTDPIRINARVLMTQVAFLSRAPRTVESARLLAHAKRDLAFTTAALAKLDAADDLG
jgi:hypothetical protein